MGTIRVEWGKLISNGTYTSDRNLVAIEDPREATYDKKKLMTGKEWETIRVNKKQPFTITGSFDHRDKTWYLVKSKKEKQMVINHILLINALLKPVK